MFLCTKRKTELLGPLKQVFFRKNGILVPYLDLNILKSLLDSEVKVSHIVVILSSTLYCSLDDYCKKKVRENID